KMEGVRRALADLGGDAKPMQIQGFLREKLGIAMSTDHISTYKGVLAKKGKGKGKAAREKPGPKPPPAAAAGAPAPPPGARPGRGQGGRGASAWPTPRRGGACWGGWGRTSSGG